MDLLLGDTRLIINACKAVGLLRNQAAYVLATAYHETAHTVEPVREMGGEKYLKAKKYYPYVGMGYVQLTWRENYEKAGAALGVDFVAEPKLLLQARFAAPILVTGMAEGWFTGKKLADYLTLGKSDFVNARRIVNGTDDARLIGGYAREYDAALKAEGYGEEPAVTAPTATVQQGIGTKPDVVLVGGPKADETQVVIVQTPKNEPAKAPVPSSKTGFYAFGAMVIAIVTAALKYFGG